MNIIYNCVNKESINIQDKITELNQKLKIVNNLISINKNYENQDYKNELKNISETGLTDETIIDFITKKNKIFNDINILYNEQIRFMELLQHPSKEKCKNIYYFYIEDETTKKIIISMFVSVHHDPYKIQTHFYIVKDINYIIDKYIAKQPELKDSSILLHSFASDSFAPDSVESYYWCTSPLVYMKEILKSKNIGIVNSIENDEGVDTISEFNAHLINMDKKPKEEREKGPGIVVRENVPKQSRIRSKDKQLCYIRDNIKDCINIKNTRDLWKKADYEKTTTYNDDDVVVNIIAKEISVRPVSIDHKYLKYKTKYLNLKFEKSKI
jgi:hypothetical protein